MLLRAHTGSKGEDTSFCFLTLLPSSPMDSSPFLQSFVCLLPDIPSLTQSPSHPTCCPTAPNSAHTSQTDGPDRIISPGLQVLRVRPLYLHGWPWSLHWMVGSSNTRTMPHSPSCIPQGLPLWRQFMYILKCFMNKYILLMSV